MNPCHLVGNQGRNLYATSAHFSKSPTTTWRPWLESNQQHAVLETAATPPSYGLDRSGVADGNRTRKYLVHSQALSQSSLSHTATIEALGASNRTRTDPASLQPTSSALPKAAFSPLNCQPTNPTSARRQAHQLLPVWRLRPDLNRHVRLYESRVLPLALRSHWRTRRDSNPRSTA